MARGGILAFAKGNKVKELEEANAEGNKVKELEEANAEGLASPDELTATDVQYSPNQGFGGVLTNILADRHRESFGKKPTTPPEPPPEPPPPPSAFAAGPDVNPQDARLANSRPPALPPAPPAPPVPPPQGIAQAAAAQSAAPARPPAPAPAGIKGAPAYPTQTKLPDTPEEIAYRAQAAAVNAETNKPLASYVEDVKAGYKAAGIEPENTGMKDYRSRIMAERANLDDEAKRQKNLRLAEFFASWGSTPGATLVAGMSALKKTIPTLIEDEKERKKAMRESDKIIYDLEQADRLEKKGLVAEAAAKKERTADRAEKFNAGLATIAGNKRTAEVTDTGHKATYQANVFNTTTHAAVEQARIASAAADRAASKDATDYSKAMGAYQIANDSLAKVQSAIGQEKAKGEYAKAINKINSLEGMAKNNPEIEKQLTAPRAFIKSADEAYAARISDAEKMVSIAEARVKANDKGAAILSNATGIPDVPPQGAVRLKSK
jgi:hypothetical protein